jgi:hypothetical protein
VQTVMHEPPPGTACRDTHERTLTPALSQREKE